MTIRLTTPELQELKPKIMVFGVGGAGGNAVANMIKARLEGVDFDVADAGHMVAGDRNDAFSKAVIEFLTDVKPSV